MKQNKHHLEMDIKEEEKVKQRNRLVEKMSMRKGKKKMKVKLQLPNQHNCVVSTMHQ